MLYYCNHCDWDAILLEPLIWVSLCSLLGWAAVKWNQVNQVWSIRFGFRLSRNS
ncbi:unnamed protein product [Musa acuminata var. zebrina]